MPLLQKKAVEVRSQKGQLKRIEDLGAAMEERLILDNRSVQGLWCVGHGAGGETNLYPTLNKQLIIIVFIRYRTSKEGVNVKPFNDLYCVLHTTYWLYRKGKGFLSSIIIAKTIYRPLPLRKTLQSHADLVLL